MGLVPSTGKHELMLIVFDRIAPHDTIYPGWIRPGFNLDSTWNFPSTCHLAVMTEPSVRLVPVSYRMVYVWPL